MIIDCKGKYGKFLRLGIQTNKDNVKNASLKMAKAWKPKNAKSFTITHLTHTDYHGNFSEVITGYATINVNYFNTTNEGKYNV